MKKADEDKVENIHCFDFLVKTRDECFVILNAAIDSQIRMLIDAPKEHSPGLLDCVNAKIKDELISNVEARDTVLILIIELIFPLFIASMAEIIDIYVIGIVGDSDFRGSEELLNGSPKISMQIGRENLKIKIEKTIKAGRTKSVDLSDISIRLFMLSVLDSMGVKTAFIAGVKITPRRIMLFAAP
jgi:hypothetical protein